MNALRELAAKKEALAAERHVDDLKRLFFPKLRFDSDPVRISSTNHLFYKDR